MQADTTQNLPGVPFLKFNAYDFDGTTKVTFFGDDTYISTLDQYTKWMQSYMDASLTFTQSVVSSRALREVKLKDLYMYDLVVYNVQRPLNTANTSLALTQNIITLFFFVLKEDYGGEKFKKIYKRRTLEDVYDIMYSYALIPPLAYPTSEGTWQTYGDRRVEMPTPSTVGERHPDAILEKIDPNNNPLQIDFSRNPDEFCRIQGATRPLWAHNTEIGGEFRNVYLPLFNIEVARLDQMENTILVETMIFDELEAQLIQESTSRRRINVEKTAAEILKVGEDKLQKRTYNNKVTLRVDQQSVAEIVGVSQVFVIAVWREAEVRIRPLVVYFNPATIQIETAATFALVQGILPTTNGSIVLNNVNTDNATRYIKTIAMALFNPSVIKIDLINIDLQMTHILPFLLVMVSLCQSCMFTETKRIQICNAIYTALYDTFILQMQGQMPHPSVLQNRSINALNILYQNIMAQSPQVRTLLRELVSNRPPAQNNHWMFGDGSAPNAPMLNDPLFPGSFRAATCVRPDDTTTFKNKITNVITAYTALRQAPMASMNSDSVEQITGLIFANVQNIVGLFRDAGVMALCAAAESVWSDTHDRSFMGIRPKLITLDINGLAGSILGQSDDRYPLYNIMPDSSMPIDSLIYLYRVCRRMRLQFPRISWSEVFSNTKSMLETSGIVLDQTFLELILEPEVRDSLQRQAGYQLPDIYNQFDRKQRQMVNFVPRLKEQQGFDTVFYITFCKAQYNIRYQGTDYTNAFAPAQLNVMGVYGVNDLLKAMTQRYIDPQQREYAVRRITQFDKALEDLRREPIPMLNEMATGVGRIPVIQIAVKCIVNTTIEVSSSMIPKRSSTPLDIKHLLDSVVEGDEFMQLDEHISIYDGLLQESIETIDMNNISVTPIVVPRMNASRIVNVDVGGLKRMVRMIETRKKPYEYTPEYNVYVVPTRYGTVV